MNKGEFTRRVLAVEGRLYRISCGMLDSHPDRLDAVQEAVLKAWANLSRLREEKYFETWLTRILINECHNIQHARSKSGVPLENAPEPVAPPGANRELREAISELSMELRLPILLYYMEGYKLREVAQILGVPEGTVKTRLLRAKKRLRTMLEEEEERA